MNKQMSQQHYIDIDFKELTWRLLSQWKAIMIVSLIMAVVVCGTKYALDVKEYEAEATAKNNNINEATPSDDEQIAAIMEALPESERETVSLIINEKEWVENQKAYISQSILLKTDSTNQRVLKMVFKIDSENAALIPALLHDYSIYVGGDDVTEAIKPYIDTNAEDKYISELFYTDEKKVIESEIEENGAAFEINLVLPETTDAEAVLEAINNTLGEHCKDLQKYYSHSISCFGAEEQHIYHKDNVDRRVSMYNSLNNLEYSLRTNEGNLSGEQAAAVNAIMAIKNKKSTETIIEGDTSSETITPPGWRMKYAFLGLLLGAFAYAFIYAAKMILSGRVETASNISRITNIRIIGEIYCDSEAKGAKRIMHSDAVERLRYRKRNSTDEQIEKTTGSLNAICQHVGTKDVKLFNMIEKCETSKFENAAIAAIIEKASKKEIDIESINAVNGVDEGLLIGKEAAVVVANDETRISDIVELNLLFDEYDTNKLGIVYFAKKK